MSGTAPSAFARALAGAPGPLFAVLDGALAPGAVAEAEGMGLSPRPLWLEVADEAARAAGPHIVNLPGLPAPETLLSWTGGRGVMAVWAWDAGRLALYRHLRGLNMARVPVQALTPPGEPAPAPEPDGCGWALFRHHDPLVLQAVAPTLDRAQAARLLGPARGLLFGDPAAGGALGPAPVGAGPDAAGPLRFRPGQLDAIAARRVADGEARTLAFLAGVAPTLFAGQPPAATRAWVQDWRGRGQVLGLAAERDLALWCVLVIATRGAALGAPEAGEAVRAGSAAAVRAILSGLAAGSDAARGVAAALPAAGRAIAALAPAFAASGFGPAGVSAAFAGLDALTTQHAAAPAPCLLVPPRAPPAPPSPTPAREPAPTGAGAPGDSAAAGAGAGASRAARRARWLGPAPSPARRAPDPIHASMRARGLIRDHAGPDGATVGEFAGSDGLWRPVVEGDIVLSVDIAGFWRSAGANRAQLAARGLADPASYALDAYGLVRKAAAGAPGRQLSPVPRARRPQGAP